MSEPFPRALSMEGGAGLRSDGVSSMEAEEMEQRQLKTRWAELMGHPDPVMHKKASVLLLYWNPDKKVTDMDVSKEIVQLQEVFENNYNFKVVEGVLDTKRGTYPQAQAFRHVSNFVHDEDEDNGLLIIYYAGHGYTEAPSLGRITLSGLYREDEEEKNNASIEWSAVESALSKTKSDVMEIFDCCHSGLLCVPAEQRSFTRGFDVLTACAHDQKTPGPGKHSFTTALIWALKQLTCKEGFPASRLHAKIQKYPDFDARRSPQLYNARFDSSGEFLHIAPMPKQGEEASGPFRSERNEEAEKEQMLDLRFHYRGEITDADLKHLAKALKNKLLHFRQVKAHRVSLLGKYNMATYKLTRESKVMMVGKTWSDLVRRKSSAAARPSISTHAGALMMSTADENSTETDENMVAGPLLQLSPETSDPDDAARAWSRKRHRSDRVRSL